RVRGLAHVARSPDAGAPDGSAVRDGPPVGHLPVGAREGGGGRILGAPRPSGPCPGRIPLRRRPVRGDAVVHPEGWLRGSAAGVRFPGRGPGGVVVREPAITGLSSG